MSKKTSKIEQKIPHPIDKDGMLKKYAEWTNLSIILIKKKKKTKDEMWALFDTLNDIELLNNIVRDEIK